MSPLCLDLPEAGLCILSPFNFLRQDCFSSRLGVSDGRGFSDGSDGKESDCNAGDLDLTPGVEISPGEGHGNPLQYSCLKNSMDREAWWLQSMGLQRVRHN